MKKILILSVFPAPYRVNVFKLMSEELLLDVYFEVNRNECRSEDFFCKKSEFNYKILTNSIDLADYKKSINNLQQYEFVLAYDYSTKAAMKLMHMCIHNNIPYFINCDGAFIKHNFLKDILKRYFISHARACFANGIHAKEYFLAYGAKESDIICHNFSTLFGKDILTNCLTCSEKRKIRQELGINDKKTVITVGQFIYRKGFDILLKAWTKINNDINLIIIGGGEEEKAYEKFINDNSLKNIKILDFKPFNEILKYFKACDLFVLPTREDVWGLVINEAMACGLPVITTERCVAGLELVKDDENGYIVPVGDVDMLTEKINYILKNDDIREKMSESSLKKIKPYTIENVAKSHIRTLKGLLNL